MPAPASRWEHFAHGADVGVRGIGPTMASAFEQAGLALTAVVCEPAGVRAEEAVAVECQAPARDLLFVDWLDAITYEMATRRMVFGAFEVRVDDGSLHGVLRGEPVDRARHQPSVEVKGATHTELRVEPRADGTWLAQCVVDV